MQVQKPTALDLHCLQRKGISGFSRTRIKRSEIFSICHSLLLIQEGQLSVSGKECTQVLKYWLTAKGTKPAYEKCD